MAKEKPQIKKEVQEKPLETAQNEPVENAVKVVKDYLLQNFPRGLVAGKQIEITTEEKEALRQFNWDIPIFKKLEESTKEEDKKVLNAVQSLKKQGYKIYLIKTSLGGVKSWQRQNLLPKWQSKQD